MFAAKVVIKNKKTVSYDKKYELCILLVALLCKSFTLAGCRTMNYAYFCSEKIKINLVISIT